MSLKIQSTLVHIALTPNRIKSNADKIASAVTKIVLAIPEYQKLTAERRKIDAETESIRRGDAREDVKMLLNQMGKNGITKITLGDKMQITIENGELKIIEGHELDQIQRGDEENGEEQSEIEE